MTDKSAFGALIIFIITTIAPFPLSFFIYRGKIKTWMDKFTTSPMTTLQAWIWGIICTMVVLILIIITEVLP